MNIQDEYSPLENDELSEYDIYGKTPPRTKILRKNRERKQKEKSTSTGMATPKVGKAKMPLSRRNTVGTVYNEISRAGDGDNVSDNEMASNKNKKRQIKLLRGSERDLKLDIVSAQAATAEKLNGQYFNLDYPKTPSYQVEGYKRFRCLSGRTTMCNRLNSFNENYHKMEHLPVGKDCINIGDDESLSSRVSFYNTFKLLIRMGCNGDKQSQDCRNTRRAMSREETLWQNELKDIIWLELQAYHADRSPAAEDEFLCKARDIVNPILTDIQNFRFQRHNKKYLSQNSDSGVEEDCAGCLSIFCISCMEAQNEGLRDIDTLLKRLEEAESLFPSSKAFAELYPLYQSEKIVARVKAMCLWYNMTKHQRLKVNILARLLVGCLENKHGNWPTLSDEVCLNSPSDSNNSSASSNTDCNILNSISDLYNITSMAAVMSKRDANNVTAYRRYIENVLKTKELSKSIMFIERLHQNVLRKSYLTLKKPENEDIYFKNCSDLEEEEELCRYGIWSPEAKSLDLPSYRTTFVFLSVIPLKFIHEYLLMRLEHKPDNPSPLSVRQLMRELKEGLHIAIRERQRVCDYVEVVITENEKLPQSVLEKIDSFDDCIVRLFTDYLEYLEKWVLFHDNALQKTLLEEEFQFSSGIVKHIRNGPNLLLGKFSYILGTIFKRIGDRLVKRIYEVLSLINKENEGTFKQAFFKMCRKLQYLFNQEREMSLKTIGFCKTAFKNDFNRVPLDSLEYLKDSIMDFKCIIPNAIEKVQGLFDCIHNSSLEKTDKNALNSRLREILMQIYRFGFDFYKEMSDQTPDDQRDRLVHAMVNFANLWMKFVTKRCERGRGMRPRWAYQGLEFLLTVCEPENTKHLSEEKFENLKSDMDVCISHVIGTTAPSTPESGFNSASPRSSLEHIKNRSRGSSPSTRPTYKIQRSVVAERKISVEQQSPGADFVDYTLNLNTANVPISGRKNSSTIQIKLPPQSHSEHIQDAVEGLETELDKRLREKGLIGKVVSSSSENQNFIRRRNVTFSWQRGIKIGQGRFGKVYTAVNNDTGDMMAVKELVLQHNDVSTIKRVLEEIKILEGISHKNLVRYYGVEIHKDELFIFMEFCAEGTLESLIAATEKGLPELLIRRYTFQIVSGVACLHDHGIVHRDIKTANIFLTDGGNCLKIGDFGCAAKIKSNVTMAGELKGFVGTQAYMAPEVFTRNMTEGHGRGVDIWSIGCVVVEMASGKRPWAHYDSNYQIMFKVGMGQSPDPPDDMIDEGLDFLEICFKHDPSQRATASQLLNSNFVKVGED